jgi:hypothetical protein
MKDGVKLIAFLVALFLLASGLISWLVLVVYGSENVSVSGGYREVVWYIVLLILPIFLYVLGVSVVWKVLKFYTAKRWGWDVEVEVIETSGGKYDPVSYKVGMYSPARILLMFVTALWPIIPVTAAVVFLVVVIYGAIKNLVGWGRSASAFFSSRIIQLIDK